MPGSGPGIRRPAGNIAYIRELLTFDRIRNGSGTAQKRLHKTIKNLQLAWSPSYRSVYQSWKVSWPTRMVLKSTGAVREPTLAQGELETFDQKHLRKF